MSHTADAIRVLHVDDDRAFLDMTAEFLEREDERLDVETATSARAGLDLLADGAVDCVVSDYDMPGRNGIEFLEAVREEHPDLPFILYTGEGSEAIASEAVSAGVTGYMRKVPGTDRYGVLANRIDNAVARYRARQRAAVMERRYRALFEHSEEAIAWVEFDGDTPVVRDVNPAFEATFDPPDGIAGADLDAIVAPDDRLEGARDLTRTVRGGESVRRRVTREAADGTRTLWLRAIPVGAPSDEVRYGFAIYTELPEEERPAERLRAFVEESTDLITVLEPDGTIRYESPSIEHVLGYEPADLVGENAFEYVHPDDRTEVMEAFEAAVADPELTPTAEYRFRHADGSWRWMESRGNNQLDNPAVEGFVVNTREITDRVARERALQRKNERLEEFASVLSHDLTGPLNAIDGRLELAREECDSDHLEYIERSRDRMAALIEDVLALVRHGEAVTDPEPVDLATLAEECWGAVGTADATFVVDASRTVRADESQLRQALANLVRNSVEHGSTSSQSGGDDAPERGPASSRGPPDDAGGPGSPGVTVRIGDLPDGFYVEDDGPGIPPEAREDVFEAGYSSAHGSTGLGLSIVRRVVEAHGWEIRATGGTDGGARFEITGVEPAGRPSADS